MLVKIVTKLGRKRELLCKYQESYEFGGGETYSKPWEEAPKREFKVKSPTEKSS